MSKAFRYVEAYDKEELKQKLAFYENNVNAGMDDLFECLSDMCENSSRPIVLMINEVDSVSNNQVFIDFLAQLRGYYLERAKTPIFHSVILAGVYSIKNLKLKLRPEAEHRYNSPWNMAADFEIDMEFSVKQIAGMLQEYEADCQAGMDIQAIAEEIYAYTSGYPVLVSSIFKYIDEDPVGNGIWSSAGITKAVKSILIKNMPLFESMIRHLNDYPQMKQMFRAIPFQGREFAYSPDAKEKYFNEIYGEKDMNFIEKYGRKFFLLYLKPIINGTGNYYIKAQTRDARRTDVIVDYLGEQFIVELKIWHGEEYNERGERQLAEYLDYYHKDKGYMLSFNFNKNKKIGVNEIKEKRRLLKQ